MNQNPQALTNEEIIAEISGLRDEIERKGTRVHELSNALYRRVRKAPADDTTAIYLTYANAWMRFSGMVSQGITRTAGAVRILKRLPPQPQAAVEPIKTPKPKRRVNSPMESLIAMFGDDYDMAADEIGAQEGTENV
jgi:hypothetical protein